MGLQAPCALSTLESSHLLRLCSDFLLASGQSLCPGPGIQGPLPVDSPPCTSHTLWTAGFLAAPEATHLRSPVLSRPGKPGSPSFLDRPS